MPIEQLGSLDGFEAIAKGTLTNLTVGCVSHNSKHVVREIVFGNWGLVRSCLADCLELAAEFMEVGKLLEALLDLVCGLLVIRSLLIQEEPVLSPSGCRSVTGEALVQNVGVEVWLKILLVAINLLIASVFDEFRSGVQLRYTMKRLSAAVKGSFRHEIDS